MSLIPILAVALALAAMAGPAPRAAVHAQCGGAYTDEMAGSGGTYGGGAECGAAEVSTEDVPVGGFRGAAEDRNATARDNPDAPPVDRDTATYEGEREQ